MVPHGPSQRAYARDGAGRITEQMAIFEARVFLDRSDAEPFSMSVAQQQLQDNRDFIRGAQNEGF